MAALEWTAMKIDMFQRMKMPADNGNVLMAMPGLIQVATRDVAHDMYHDMYIVLSIIYLIHNK